MISQKCNRTNSKRIYHRSERFVRRATNRKTTIEFMSANTCAVAVPLGQVPFYRAVLLEVEGGDSMIALIGSINCLPATCSARRRCSGLSSVYLPSSFRTVHVHICRCLRAATNCNPSRERPARESGRDSRCRLAPSLPLFSPPVGPRRRRALQLRSGAQHSSAAAAPAGHS